jgi:hypothetical protein
MNPTPYAGAETRAQALQVTFGPAGVSNACSTSLPVSPTCARVRALLILAGAANGRQGRRVGGGGAVYPRGCTRDIMSRSSSHGRAS